MRRWTRALTIGLGTAVLGALLARTPVGLDLDERFGLSWLFLMRGPVAPPEEVVVVSLDRRSAELLDLPEEIRDWPRTVHARLIRRLVEADASVVVFDLILDEPRDPANDAALAQAMAMADRVVLFELLDELVREVPDGRGSITALVETEQLRLPRPQFAQVAAGSGPFPLPKVPARVNQFWTYRGGFEGRPTLPLVALQRHALQVYPEWRRLLETVGFPGELAPDADRLRSATELLRFMLAMRQGFLADPTLGLRLRRQLDEAAPAPQARPLLAALIAMYDGPDSRFLNFYGPSGQITTVPLDDVLSGDPAAGSFAGRVVFVGQSEPMNINRDDGFVTVFSRPDGVDISGVEIAATAFANLLERRTLEPSGPLAMTFLVAGFGLAIGVLAASWPAAIAVPAALVLAALYYAGAQLAFSAHALWLPLGVPLLVQLPLGLFAGLLAQYREARRARLNISRAMRYYLPEKVAAGLAEAPLDPGALTERVYAACMVTDAERFTSVAEGMSPEEVSGFLNRYFEILFGVVERHGGLVTDVVGDGTTSIWTAVQPQRSCRLRACLAALEIDRAVGEFNRCFGEHRLPTRIGLHAGPAMVGNVGGSGRFAYSVMGDSVNTAARIESLNKQLGTRLLATEIMAADLAELVVRPLGRFQLVGKREALTMLEIVGRSGEAHDERLLAAFALALGAFERQDWACAGERFETILLRCPNDGPSRFYLEACHRYAHGATPPEPPGLVRLERK